MQKMAAALEESAQRAARVGVPGDHLHRQRRSGIENSFHLAGRPFLFYLIDKNPLKAPQNSRRGEKQDEDGRERTPGSTT